LFTSNFVKDIDIDLAMESSVERGVEGIPQAIEQETWLIVVLDCFHSW